MKIVHLALILLITTSCQSQDIHQSQLKELKAAIAEKIYPKIEGIIVEQGDEILIAEYFNGFDKDTRHDMRSSFKSVTSLLTGIAIDKGLMSINDSLIQYFPELKNSKKGNILIRNLLEMRSGLNCEEFYDIGPDCEGAMWDSDDWIAYCLNVKLLRQPGLFPFHHKIGRSQKMIIA